MDHTVLGVIGKGNLVKTIRDRLGDQQVVEIVVPDLARTHWEGSIYGPDVVIWILDEEDLEKPQFTLKLLGQSAQPVVFGYEGQGFISAGPLWYPGFAGCIGCAAEILHAAIEDVHNAGLSREFQTDNTAFCVKTIAGRILSDTGYLLGQQAETYPGLLDTLVACDRGTGEITTRPLTLGAQENCQDCADLSLPQLDISPISLENYLRARLELHSGLGPRPSMRWSDARQGEKIETIVVVGGGTAGFFSALALKTRFPNRNITLVESPGIPIIGVGEATTPLLGHFLFQVLGFDKAEFYRKVRPTWKQSIRFFWGLPGNHHFHNPFGLGDVFASYYHTGSINASGLIPVLSDREKTPVFRVPGRDERYFTLLNALPHAFHLDNALFVRFLHEKAREAGIHYRRDEISRVELNEKGTHLTALYTAVGEKISADFYIDCSGFASLLMGKTFNSPYLSFADSLFTDRAIVANVPHGGRIRPYTMADSMQHGWTWGIPLHDSDHRGYVFASAFCSDDEAEAEMRQCYPGMGKSRVVRFRSGRHTDFIRGNVAAIGNSYGFVEPLESTGIHMIIQGLLDLCTHFPQSKQDDSRKQLLNEMVGAHWDFLKWFLALHYKFNRKFDTPFWKACRADCDISGIRDVIEVYRESGSLSHLSGHEQEILLPFRQDVVFGTIGFDTMLLGQGVTPTHEFKPGQSRKIWLQKVSDWSTICDIALGQVEALEVLNRNPELLEMKPGMVLDAK